MKKLLIVLAVMLLSSCALLDKLRGAANPHSEILIEVPNTLDVETPTTVEDVRG